MNYNFDQILDRKKLSTSKWEMERARRHNENLLCFGTADMDFKSSKPVIDALREESQRKPEYFFSAIPTILWEEPGAVRSLESLWISAWKTILS